MTAMIQAEGLSKSYSITRRTYGGTGYLSDAALKAVLRSARRAISFRNRPARQRKTVEELWALSDISFTVQPGEVVGLVGHNGAGKTTLLRVMSRVTDPTSGRMVLDGRLNSLLEVGIGFHGELTGRENIFMKAVIHGQRRDDVRRNFDDIVAFAEIERFLDTPLKRYSSGMRSRLGFAIGAYLDHEILVVDEVLAVGDARFRQRAMARIREASEQHGTTTIFVSHDMAQIRALCPRSILLEKGRVIADGDTADVLKLYLQPKTVDGIPAAQHFTQLEKRHIRQVSLRTTGGEASTTFRVGDGLSVEILAEATGAYPDLDAHLVVDTLDGDRLFRFRASMVGVGIAASGDEAFRLVATVDQLPLTPGHYWISVSLGRGHGAVLERATRALRFEVLPRDPYGAGGAFLPADGPLWVRGSWSAALPVGDDASADDASE